MLWKRNLIYFTMIATCTCFAQENGKDRTGNSPEISKVDHIQTLLSGILEKNKLHGERVLKSVATDDKAPKSIFNPMLEMVQAGVNQRINAMEFSTEANAAATYDFDQLGSLWAGLQRIPRARVAMFYCQALYKKAQMDLNSAPTDEAKNGIAQNAWVQIGSAVFIAERYPAELSSLITLTDLEGSQSKIANRCLQEMQHKLTECAAYHTKQHNAGIQNANLGLSFFQPKQIAKILLTSTGKLNLGMIPLIRTTFIPQSNPLEYQVGMDRVLTSMNSGWQPIIDQITAPISGNIASQDIIRTDLGLSLSEPLTALHSKQVALKAILSQLNQGATGDCFAVAWAIKKHNDYLIQSLQDFGQLLQNGYLTRTVNGKPDQFFFLNSLADTDLQRSITLDSSGTLNGKVKIWEAPGITAACLQMGISDVKAHMQDAIAPLFKNGSKSIQTTPQNIIAAFAAYSSDEITHLAPEVLIKKGTYGFSIAQDHLLRAWETSLAGMAEAVSGDLVRNRTDTALAQALHNQWSSMKGALPQEQHMLVAQLENAFMNTLNSLSRYVYNAAIPLPQVSRDGSSSKGGFELYQIDPNQPQAMGQKITAPTDFSAFLVQVASQAASALFQTYNTPDEMAALSAITSMLVDCLQNQAFLAEVFYVYDDSNKLVADPVANYQKLKNTPMTTLQGDNPFVVEAVDTGTSFLPDVKTISPKNPYQLVKWILDLARWKEETQHYLENNMFDGLDPAISPQHAFNIAFDDQDIKTFVLSNQSSDEWLQSRAIQPDIMLATMFIDDTTKQTVSANFVQWMQVNVQLPTEALNYLQNSFATLNQKQLSLQAYAAQCLIVIKDLFKPNESIAEQLAVIFDSVFLQSLPSSVVQMLSQTAVLFAKTNWDDGEKNIYFCTYFNPRTETLGFASIDEDRTNLSVMDEYAWIDQQTWEVVPVEELVEEM